MKLPRLTEPCCGAFGDSTDNPPAKMCPAQRGPVLCLVSLTRIQGPSWHLPFIIFMEKLNHRNFEGKKIGCILKPVPRRTPVSSSVEDQSSNPKSQVGSQIGLPAFVIPAFLPQDGRQRPKNGKEFAGQLAWRTQPRNQRDIVGLDQ